MRQVKGDALKYSPMTQKKGSRRFHRELLWASLDASHLWCIVLSTWHPFNQWRTHGFPTENCVELALLTCLPSHEGFSLYQHTSCKGKECVKDLILMLAIPIQIFSNPLCQKSQTFIKYPPINFEMLFWLQIISNCNGKCLPSVSLDNERLNSSAWQWQFRRLELNPLSIRHLYLVTKVKSSHWSNQALIFKIYEINFHMSF